jgi:hypothetical protein
MATPVASASPLVGVTFHSTAFPDLEVGPERVFE